jgi:hypothetical protein
MRPEDDKEVAPSPATPEELVQAQRHRTIIIAVMVILVLLPLAILAARIFD